MLLVNKQSRIRRKCAKRYAFLQDQTLVHNSLVHLISPLFSFVQFSVKVVYDLISVGGFDIIIKAYQLHIRKNANTFEFVQTQKMVPNAYVCLLERALELGATDKKEEKKNNKPVTMQPKHLLDQ